MKPIQKIAVIGGTGKSGKYLVKQLSDQGFHFKSLVRNADTRPPESFQNPYPFAEIVKGDVRDEASVKSLIEGCDAVISTLGWGIPPSGHNICSQATQHIIRAMQAYRVSRYILATGLHVDTPSDHKSPKAQHATDWMYANYPESTADRQAEYQLLADSDIHWTMVRLPLIVQTDARHETSVSLEDCPGDSISATDLGHFLIAQLSDDTYIRKAPFIANS